MSTIHDGCQICIRDVRVDEEYPNGVRFLNEPGAVDLILLVHQKGEDHHHRYSRDRGQLRPPEEPHLRNEGQRACGDREDRTAPFEEHDPVDGEGKEGGGAAGTDR